MESVPLLPPPPSCRATDVCWSSWQQERQTAWKQLCCTPPHPQPEQSDRGEGRQHAAFIAQQLLGLLVFMHVPIQRHSAPHDATTTTASIPAPLPARHICAALWQLHIPRRTALMLAPQHNIRTVWFAHLHFREQAVRQLQQGCHASPFLVLPAIHTGCRQCRDVLCEKVICERQPQECTGRGDNPIMLHPLYATSSTWDKW